MSKLTPTDYQVRAEAVDPSRSFLVQAPAGSGKTELLTDRILALLALVQQPEEIVAITFTRAAAAEMHARVIEKLQAALGPEPEEAYKKQSWLLARQAMANNDQQGWDLLTHPVRLSIRTIDSLCAHLVKAMPWMSGLGGVPQVTEQASELYAQAAQAIIDKADENESVAYLIKHLGVNIANVEELLVEMLGVRDQWLPALFSYGVHLPELLEASLESTITEYLERLEAELPYGWQDLAPCAVYANENLLIRNKGDSPLAALGDWIAEHPLKPVPEDLLRWQALIPFLTTGGELRKPRGITARQGLPANGDKALVGQIKEWLENEAAAEAPWLESLLAIEYLPVAYSSEQLELLQHLAQVLVLTVAELRLAFIEAGQVDFIEIAQRAYDALGKHDNPSELLLRLDRRISHLLVDEFQDTSFSQHLLLNRLTSGWEFDDGRTVFLVGDPMQSIYRFRKADVGLFLKVQAEQRLGEVELEVLTLSDNFRSTENVVQWINELGEQLFPQEPNADLGAVSYTPSVAFQPFVSHSEVACHPFLYSRKDPSAMDAEQARQLAEQRVVELCRVALQYYPDSPKPAAVLVRNRSHLGEVIRALNAAGIATKAVDIDVLTARPVVQDIVQLVRALSHPGDRLAWLALLRSPICGLRLASLHALCGHDRKNTIPELIRQLQADSAAQALWPTDEWQRLEHVAKVLLDQSYRSGTLPFAARVQHCWQRLGGEQVYARPRDRVDAENVFRLLEQTAPYGAVDLDLLEQHIEGLYASAESVERAVEVMTIHRAKGLEFESVILYDLNRIPRPDSEPLLRFEQSGERMYVGMAKASDAEQKEAISDFIKEREKQRGVYELQRLLYVAVTRARSQLHLIALAEVSGKEDQEPKVNGRSLLHLLWSKVEADFQMASLSQEQEGEVLTHVPAYTYLQRLSSVNNLPAVRPAVAPRGINHWQWNEEPLREAAIGTVAHAWLERIGRDGRVMWSTEKIKQSAAVIQRQLLRAGVMATEVGLAVQEVQDTLLRTLESERGQWLLDAARAYREWSLLDAQGRVSIIDLAISQEDHWLIVDFKTAIPASHQSNEDFLALMRERYAPQLQRYCEQVTALDGRAARAALYFPRADLWCELVFGA